MVMDRIRRRNIPVVVTTVIGSPGRSWESYDHQYSLPARLYRAGVRFAISGSASAPYAHRLPWEAGAASAFGLPMEEAINALTVYPADTFGLSDNVGTLETGKNTTFLIATNTTPEDEIQIGP